MLTAVEEKARVSEGLLRIINFEGERVAQESGKDCLYFSMKVSGTLEQSADVISEWRNFGTKGPCTQRYAHKVNTLELFPTILILFILMAFSILMKKI